MQASTLRACGLATVALTLVALPTGCASTQTAPSDRNPSLAAVGDGTLAPGRYDLVVHGMSCPKCISNVELQLTRITGVTRPVVDMKNGIVAIDVTGGANPSKDAIANAIADSGFTLVEIRGGNP